MYNRLLLLILFTFFAASAFCQDGYIVISGKVTDSNTRQPIAAANILLKKGSAGTITNSAGDFVFKIPEAAAGDSMLISCIGYRPLARSVAARGNGIVITLEPAIIALPEVSIHVTDALDILKRAIAAIPRNYDTANVRLTAFYREDIRYDHDTLNFNESVLDIFKTFRTGKGNSDQIRILKGRKMPSPPNDDPQFYGWIGNIRNTAYSALGEDIIKYRDAKNSTLAEHNFRYYNYTLLETINEDNRRVQVIRVSPRDKTKKGLLRGKIYIDASTLAIVKYTCEVTPAGIDYVNKHGKGGVAQALMAKIMGGSIDFKGIAQEISYRPYQGKYYLSAVQRHWDITVNSRKRNIKDVPWQGNFSFLVTDVSKDSAQRFQTAISSNNTSMNHLIGKDYDAAFWEHYNILQPEIPDSLRQQLPVAVQPDTIPVKHVSNRQNGFTRADTLRGQLSALRTCYDVMFYHLDVAVDLEKHSLKGSNRIRFKVQEPFERMQIDLYANMKIGQVLFKGQALSYTREYDAVFVQFPGIQPAGSIQEVTISYEGIPQVPDKSVPMNGGVLWEKDNEGNPWVQVVCQGSGASLWWPCKDHLSDEPDSMRIWVTVPDGFTEISNGQLERKTFLGNGQTRFEWRVSYPINNYNATFCIGKYAQVTDQYIGKDTLLLNYYVMPYNLPTAPKMMDKVKSMLACFEQGFGVYPFQRDGFTLVESPYPMEHQSGVCIGRISKEVNLEYPALVWHESAHEWWGNAISCRDMADMWIHEAFATYAEALVIESSLDKKTATAFLNEQKNSVSNREPVTGVYDVNHIFYDINDMYTKGSLMLHTFRSMLDNDTLWFDLLRGIQQHFRYQTVSADSLVSYICRFTKHDYTCFFKQYLQYTRLPKLEYMLKQQGNDLQVRYRWLADAAAFSMPVKVTISPKRLGFIHPALTWKTLTLKGMKAGDFEVDQEGFFIDVAEVSQPETPFVK